MANIAKKELDTRTFPQICLHLTSSEWFEIKTTLSTATGKTEQTLNNWRSGRTYPGTLSERRDVSKIVNRVLGIKTTPLTLFGV